MTQQIRYNNDPTDTQQVHDTAIRTADGTQANVGTGASFTVSRCVQRQRATRLHRERQAPTATPHLVCADADDVQTRWMGNVTAGKLDAWRHV